MTTVYFSPEDTQCCTRETGAQSAHSRRTVGGDSRHEAPKLRAAGAGRDGVRPAEGELYREQFFRSVL